MINGRTWACSFKIPVIPDDKLAGQVTPFDVQVTFTGSDPSLKAFYVPKVQVPVTYVYTGATLAKHGSKTEHTYNSITTGM